VNTSPPTAPGSRLRAAAIILLVTGIAFLWLGATRDSPRVHLDTARDWLLARDRLAGGCPSWGPVASVLDLRQGTLWLRVLAAGLAVGLDSTALQRCLEALQALGAGLLAWGAWRLGRRSLTAALLAGVYVVFLRAIEPGDQLWNPAVAHPGAAVFAVGWLGLAAGGGLGLAVLAGAGAAVAVLGHVLGLIVLPLLALGLALGRSRPIVSLATGFATFAGLVLLDSWDAAILDARALAANGYGALLLSATVAGAAGGLALRRRWLGLAEGLRLGLFLGLALVVATLAPAVIPGLVQVAEGSRFAYLLPAFAALALALGGDALSRRLPTAARRAAVAVVLALALGGGRAAWHSRDHAGPDALWRLPELERLAADLYGRGATFAELFRRVQGPWDTYVVGTLAGLDPSPLPSDDDHGPGHGLLVLRLAKAAVPATLPAGWRRVDVSHDYAALLRDAPGGVAADDLVRCSPAPDGLARCARFERRWRAAREHPPEFADRQYPRVATDADCTRAAPATTWSLALEPADRPRLVRLAASRWEGCAWRLDGATSADGLEARLEPTPAPRRVVVATVETAPHPARCAPPPLIVGPADDPVILAFLEAPCPP